jgi:hypothetical protein
MKKQTILVFVIIALVFSLIYMAVSAYFILTIDSKESVPEKNETKQEIKQIEVVPEDNFPDTDEIHWGTLPIKYNFYNETKCGQYQADRVRQAFEKIANETNGIVYFQENSSSEEMTVYCEKGFPPQGYGYVLSGESRYWLKDKIIVKSEINFYNSGKYTYSGGCVNYPDVEIHEILHSLGFEHKEDKQSIMYREYRGCKYSIDDDIIEKLKEIYS